MHQYIIFSKVPSTAPLFGEDGLQTNNKVRFAGWTKANNSFSACSKASKKLDINIDKLKALLFLGDINSLTKLKPEKI